MIWQLLTYFIISASPAQYSDGWILKNADQIVLSVIENERKKTKIANLFENNRGEINAFADTKLAYARQFRVVLMEKNYSRLATDDMIRKFEAERRAFQERVIDIRLKMQHILSEEEWERAIAKGLHETAKSSETKKKQEIKINEEAKSRLDLIKKVVNEKIQDDIQSFPIIDAIDAFEMSLQKRYEELSSFNYAQNIELRNQQASKEDLTALMEEINRVRYESSNAFMDMFDVMIKNLDEEEWDVLSRELEKKVK
jgi:small-conductance mechanosensitive channel